MWNMWVSSPGSLHSRFAETTTRYYLARDPNAVAVRYDWNGDQATLATLGDANDATDTDIRPFTDAGGKLILWNGGSDPGTSKASTIDYHEKATAALGGRRAADRSCASTWNPASNDRPPGTLLARTVEKDGSVAMSRPLCTYPAYPRYKGRGDPKAASSFTCTMPARSASN